MKKTVRILLIGIALLALLVAGLHLSGNGYLIKGVQATYLQGHTTASITDKKFFDLRTISAGEGKELFYHPKYADNKLSKRLLQMLESQETAAFLVLKRGVIHYERYWSPYDEHSATNSFSMAKSITTLLVQIAIQKGLISSWDTPVVQFLPEIKGPFRETLTLRHLSEMTAGLYWEEDYHGPFDITAQTYYGSDIPKLMFTKVPTAEKPGSSFEYQSGATQYLGMALREATGMSLSAYAAQELWQPLQAQQDAYWHLDRANGMEIAYCCFNATARDFARLGLLIMNYGRYNGKQLLDESFMRYATQGQASPYYGQSFWIASPSFKTEVFAMRGHLGQYIIAIPERELVIVHTGERNLPKKDGNHPEDFMVIIEEVLRQF